MNRLWESDFEKMTLEKSDIWLVKASVFVMQERESLSFRNMFRQAHAQNVDESFDSTLTPKYLNSNKKF